MEKVSHSYIKLNDELVSEDYEKNFEQSPNYADVDIPSVFSKLKDGGIKVSFKTGALQKEFNNRNTKLLIEDLARYKIVKFDNDIRESSVSLRPSGDNFSIYSKEEFLDAKYWQISRFSYSHFENGELIIRNPKAHCFLVVHDKKILELFYSFSSPLSKEEIKVKHPEISDIVIDHFIKAKIICACTDEKISMESTDTTLQQWSFHDLIFHSLSRVGRTEKDIGGSYRFKGIIPPQPSLKENIWKAESIMLPKPNLEWLYFNDKPFTNVLESRKSIRQYSILPLTIEQLGEFLYRCARVRYEYSNDYGDFISKPYPGGGANYETEFYITINACAGIPRGMYYYDPKEHMLSLVTKPNQNMEMLLFDAHLATAKQGWPQILITLANRFSRFNWKYSSMSYAAQLKNIGVIYQTMYLVATSMNIGACGLGVGNTERFSQLTGLDYFEEGSVGEFMIGKPL